MTDLISRQAALDIVFDFAETPHNMYQKIRELPSAEKHGTWNDHTCINWHGWHCSVCDYETQRKTHYCPNCGAKMERSEDGET